MTIYYCHHPFLAGMGFPLATEEDSPMAREIFESEEIIGCGNLKCSKCHRQVRIFSKGYWKFPLIYLFPRLPSLGEEQIIKEAEEKVKLVYESKEVSEFLVNDPHCRAYGCFCSNLSCYNYDDLRYEECVSWYCGGHTKI